MPLFYIRSLNGVKIYYPLSSYLGKIAKTALEEMYSVSGWADTEIPPSLKYLSTCHKWFPRPSYSSRFVNVAAAAHVAVGGGHVTSQVLARLLAMLCQIREKLFKM
jgi:hypothetical protein